MTKRHSFSKVLIGLFFISGTLSTLAQAANERDIQVTHPSNYGMVMVGAARIFPGSIQWGGAEAAGGMRLRAGGAFGFTGPARYIVEGIADNTWSWEEYSIVTGSKMLPGGAAPAMGHFFAPDAARGFELNNRYEAFVGGDIFINNAPSRGIGVADSETAPALLLDVETIGGQLTGQDMLVNPNERINFFVTPRLNESRLPDGVQPVEYVMVRIGVREEGTPCNGAATSFKLNNLTPNSFTAGEYYQYLYAANRHEAPDSCAYSIQALASIDKTFRFWFTNQRDTGSGYVNVIFSILGHYQTLNETRWPGSHATFRLRTDSDLPVVDRGAPLADFSATLVPGPEAFIQLDASASSSAGTISRYDWSIRKDGQRVSVEQPDPAQPWVARVDVDSPGTYEVGMIVEDSNGNRSEPVVIEPIVVGAADLQADAAGFDIQRLPDPEDAFRVRLSAFNQGGARYQWTIAPTNPVNGWWNRPDEAEPLFAPQPLGNTSQLEVTFYRAGPYRVTLTVTDGQQQTDATSQDIVLWDPTDTSSDLLQWYELADGLSFDSLMALGGHTSNVVFYGGVQSLDDGKFIMPVAQGGQEIIHLSPEQSVNITLGVDVSEAHSSRFANIVVLMAHTSDEGKVTFSKKSVEFAGEENYWQEKDTFDLDSWPPFFPSTPDAERMTLGNWLDIPIYRGRLEGWDPGRYEVYAGYVLSPQDDWIMFFNGKPLSFEIR